MGQPGSFAAKFIAWAKKMQAKSEATPICHQGRQRRAKSCGQITHVGQSMWAKSLWSEERGVIQGSSTTSRANRVMHVICLQPLYLWLAFGPARGRVVVE